jgi:histidinol-phosphate aminotransferase
MTATPGAGLREVEPYLSPQIDVRARLNTNECPYPLPESFSRDLTERVARIALNRYPDGSMWELRTKLAERTGVTPDRIWAANGSNEIITQLLLAYGGPGRTALTFEPTYLLHSRIPWLTHTARVSVQVEPPFEIGPSQVDEALSLHPDVIFVCSPNNPTGTVRSLETIEGLASGSDALVIVDEAYVEFGGETAMPLIDTNPNIAVVRTLSKAFALAGARVGYCVTTADVVGDLQRVRLPYHVSALTQAAGLTALEHSDEAKAILEDVRSQRERVYTALQAMPHVEAWPSAANFVLFRTSPGHPAKDVWQGLLDRGVLVRDMSSVVPETLRVTAGTREEVGLFLEAIGDLL